MQASGYSKLDGGFVPWDRSSDGLRRWQRSLMGWMLLESYDILPHRKLGIAKLKEGIQDTLGHGVR
jgi:hypothetical protein